MNRIVLDKALKALKSSAIGDDIEDKILFMKFAENQLELMTQTHYSQGKFKIPIESKFEGECFVELDLLQKIISSSRDTYVNFDLNKDILTVKYGKSRLNVKTIDHEFKNIKIEFESEFYANPQDLMESIGLVSQYSEIATKVENLRGVFVNGDLTFVGTPQKVACYKANKFGQDFFLYYPIISFLNQLKGEVKLSFSKSFIKVEGEEFEFISLIDRDMQVPQVEKIMALKPSDSSTFDSVEFVEINKSAAIIRPEKINLLSDKKYLNVSFDDFRSNYKIAIPSSFNTKFDLVVDREIFSKAVSLLSGEVKINVFNGDQSFITMNSGDFIQLLAVENGNSS